MFDLDKVHAQHFSWSDDTSTYHPFHAGGSKEASLWYHVQGLKLHESEQGFLLEKPIPGSPLLV